MFAPWERKLHQQLQKSKMKFVLSNTKIYKQVLEDFDYLLRNSTVCKSSLIKNKKSWTFIKHQLTSKNVKASMIHRYPDGYKVTKHFCIILIYFEVPRRVYSKSLAKARKLCWQPIVSIKQIFVQLEKCSQLVNSSGKVNKKVYKFTWKTHLKYQNIHKTSIKCILLNCK